MNVIVSNKNMSLLSSLEVDVIKNINGEFTVDELIGTFSNFFFNKMFLDITAIKDYGNLANIQKLSMNINMDKVILFLDDFEVTNSPAYISALISMGIYNFTRKKEGLMYLYNNPNTYKDVAHLQFINGNNTNLNNSNSSPKVNDTLMENNAIVIGFKNVTLHAGATSLVYMIKKYLSKYKNVIAIEVNKKDFTYFNDNELISVNENGLFNAISSHKKCDVILIDLNNISGEGICKDIVYLVEPSTIRLNRLVLVERDIFRRLKDKIIILNKSLLDDNDLKEFEYEAGIKVFANIPPLNDKSSEFHELSSFLNKLGID